MSTEEFIPELANTKVALNDGTSIPIIGLGTYLGERVVRMVFKRTEADKEKDKREEHEFREAVKYGIKIGYRHIDTAQIYLTEQVIGEALQYCYDNYGIKREDIYLTTKIQRKIRDKKGCIESLERSLKNLQTNYIDMVLVHSPHTDKAKPYRGYDVIEIYKVLIDYKKQGKIKSFGVSNFGIKHLQTLKELGLPKPALNQIEITPFLLESELIKYCEDEGIVLEAYSPVSQAKEFARKNKVLNDMARKYSGNGNNYTWATIMLKWGLQRGFVILPKSVNFKRIRQNGDLFGFNISDDDMKILNNMDLGGYGTKHKGRVCWFPMDEMWDVKPVKSKL
mmetsp:Transcript_65642/g.80357  ORF Transcript_65642/g.80357 Transcript_65642/m.80357 type:complete len:337 (-) Transcript_65642:135-1145(-)